MAGAIAIAEARVDQDPHNVDFSSALADCILHSGYMDSDMGRSWTPRLPSTRP